MMKFSLSLYSLVVVLGIVSGQIQGGQSEVNGRGVNNINPNYPPSQQNADRMGISCSSKVWSDSCPQLPRPFLVNMNPALVAYIVSLHNYLRVSADQANLQNPIRWNRELADLAVVNVMQCRVNHDDCAAKVYRASGQNLAVNSYEGKYESRTDDDLVKTAIQSWWSEFKASKQDKLGAGKHIAIGCAASRFFAENAHKFLFACNYATLDAYGNPERLQG